MNKIKKYIHRWRKVQHIIIERVLEIRVYRSNPNIDDLKEQVVDLVNFETKIKMLTNNNLTIIMVRMI